MCIKCSNSVNAISAPVYTTMPNIEVRFSQHPQTYCSEVAIQKNVIVEMPAFPFNNTTDLKQLKYTKMDLWDIPDLNDV